MVELNRIIDSVNHIQPAVELDAQDRPLQFVESVADEEETKDVQGPKERPGAQNMGLNLDMYWSCLSDGPEFLFQSLPLALRTQLIESYESELPDGRESTPELKRLIALLYRMATVELFFDLLKDADKQVRASNTASHLLPAAKVLAIQSAL